MLRKPHKLRVVVLGGAFCLAAAGVGARLYHLQVRDFDFYTEKAERQQTKNFVVQAERGEIVDRRGRPLATSVGTLSVYVDPKYFHAPEADLDLGALATQVAHYTNGPASAVEAKLEGKAVTSVGRQLEPEAANKIAELFDSYEVSRRGFWLHRESKRQYPRGLAPHVIGWCGTDADGDNEGKSSLELQYNSKIRGQRIEGKTSRTGLSQAMEPLPPDDILRARGNTLVLTIDAAVQEATEKAIAEAAEKFNADGCGAIVMDVESGAIISMASWPSFDNANSGTADPDARRNRNLTDPIETGSVAKLFTAAILLDTGKISLDTMIDCEGGRAVIGPRVIKDAPGHYLHVAPFYEVIRYSSNVGTVKAAQSLENEEWYGYLRRFGLGAPTGVDLPGEGSGILYGTSKWSIWSRTSLPMGYEMALTPMQIVSGIGAVVNGGELLQPYVVGEVRDSKGNVLWQAERTVRHRVVRESTSLLMRDVMEDVVLHGTGEGAQIPGYRVGGKTGTTRKSQVLDRREYIASFAGALPIDNPRVSIYCFVDNPKGAYYAAEVAAPTFQKIAEATILQLGIPPSAPFEQEVDLATIAQAADTTSSESATPSDRFFGGMPNLIGLSMAEARRRLPPSLRDVRFAGSGRVADQSPLPGSPLGSASEAVLVFRPDVEPAGASTPESLALAVEPSR